MQAMQSAAVWLNVIQMGLTFLGADKISSLKREKYKCCMVVLTIRECSN